MARAPWAIPNKESGNGNDSVSWNATPNSSAMGQDFIHSLGVNGGLIEMTAGPYATAYNGKQHTDNALYIDYMFLLNVIRMWYYRFDPTLDLRRLYVR